MKSNHSESHRSWTLLTNHGRVLLLISQNPELRIRDIAEQTDLTERSVQGIVTDLEEEGYLSHNKDGRRNIYKVHPNRPFRHKAEADHMVGELFKIFKTKKRGNK